MSVITNKASVTVSSLIIQRARPEDGGKYTCHAGSLVKPAVIKVHVIHGESRIKHSVRKTKTNAL